MSKNILFWAFIALAIIQLYIPAKMILNQETILTRGKAYHFKCEPIDPNDPFRGQYITLYFSENPVNINDSSDWKSGETAYAVLSTDSIGYAKIKSVLKKRPATEQDYIKTKVNYASSIKTGEQLMLDLPFNRFYIKESKSKDTENIYRQAISDTTHITSALVMVKNGKAALKDVLIDGTSINELTKVKH